MKESPERKGKFRSDSDKKCQVCPLKGNDQWLELSIQGTLSVNIAYHSWIFYENLKKLSIYNENTLTNIIPIYMYTVVIFITCVRNT